MNPASAAPGTATGPAAFSTLITAAELAERIDTPDWVVFDCRFDLADAAFGRRAYGVGHLPGAFYLDVEDDLSGQKTGLNGRHPLPDPARLAATLARCGVRNTTQVVAYDDAGGMSAARLWWLLRWLGHHRVAVLDGGFQAWLTAAQPLSTDTPGLNGEHDFHFALGPARVTSDYVLAHLGHPDMTVIDARSPDRFRGENELLDPVAGHIPGALNRFYRDNMDESGQFKPAPELRADFQALLDGRDARDVVHNCGSGVSACVNVLAMEVAGLSGSRLYAGSWSEWCADPSRPVATGPG